MASSYTSSPRYSVEQKYDENDIYDFNDEIGSDDLEGDEGTDDASEGEMERKEEYTEPKEQMYQDKMNLLNKQLEQLEQGMLPEYVRKIKKQDQICQERIQASEAWAACEKERVDKDYVKEKKAAAKEFEMKKVELIESLILDLEEKKRQIDQERNSIDLTGVYSMDMMEYKPVSTRKLRRRANDPIPIPEKRRKPSPDVISLLSFTLEEDDINDDLKILNKVSGKPMPKKVLFSSPPSACAQDNLYEARIEDGRLWYEKKWYSRNQPLYVDTKESNRMSAVISAVGTQEVWVRKTGDNSKLRIPISQLQKGKYMIKKRT